MTPLHRYWIDFDLAFYEEPPMSVDMGFGVTALSQDQALEIVRQRVFNGRPLPTIKNIAPNVDVSILDPRHIRPNMANPAVLGIWFPLGFQ